MPGKSMDTNLRRVFTHLQVPHVGLPTRVLVSIDIEKAFDSLDWQYMHKVLERMDFLPHFRMVVALLYSSPQVILCSFLLVEVQGRGAHFCLSFLL